MSTIIRKLVKKPLNVLGLDLVRFRPKYSLGEFASLTDLGIKTVIDVGAHEGEFAQMVKKIMPGVMVISFEPMKQEFQTLQQNLSPNGNFMAFNYAIGDSTGTVEMHRNEYSQSSSLLRMAELHKRSFPETRNETIESVELRRLDDVLADTTLKPEVLLKIDVQGFEDKVISGAEKLISRTRAMIVEVSFETLYEEQPLFDDIYRLLKSCGFNYKGSLYQLLDPSSGRVLQADALFVRPN